jgi:lysophospholipase L1-like esterase
VNIPANQAANKPDNMPDGIDPRFAIVEDIGFDRDSTNTMAQMFYDNKGKTVYYRMDWNGTWTEWIDLAPINAINFGFVQKFAVIGDSYASGEIYVADSSAQGYHAADYYSVSWGQILARKYGSECINMSKGGLTTRTWLTDAKGLTLLNSSAAQEMYLCALGINDMIGSGYGISYLGSISDITSHSSPSQYGDTFYGNYGRIIEAIKAKSPNGKIVLMTFAYNYSTNEDSFNAAIKEIAAHYSLPCIDVKTHRFYQTQSIYNTGRKWNHPTAIIYSGMAKANNELFSICAEKNSEYFKDFVPF